MPQQPTGSPEQPDAQPARAEAAAQAQPEAQPRAARPGGAPRAERSEAAPAPAGAEAEQAEGGVGRAETAARQAAGELARMGISPVSLGLDEPGTITLPPEPTDPHAGTAPADGPAPAAAAAGPYAAQAPVTPSHPPPQPSAAQAPATRAPAAHPPATQVPAAAQAPAQAPAAATGRVPATALSAPLTRPLTGAPGATPATGQDPAAAFPEEFGLVVPAGWRRLLRITTMGLVAPGAAEAMETERRLVARVRSRLTEPRTVLFVAGKGGVGTTTTAIGVTHTLATLRTDQTVLVDGRSGTRSLGERATEMRAPTTLDLANGTDHRGPLAFRNRLHLVDAPPWHLSLEPGRLGELLARLRDDFHFIGVDAGNDIGQPGLVALSHADLVVIVTATSQDCVPATQVALGRVQHSRPSLLDSVVVAVVDTARRGCRRAIRALHHELGIDPGRTVGVPHDPGLVAGERFDPDRLRSVTRESYLRLASLLAEPGARP